MSEIDQRFQQIFYQSPIGMVLKDFSNVKSSVDSIDEYSIQEIISQCMLLEANHKVFEIFQVRSFDDFMVYDNEYHQRMNEAGEHYFNNVIQTFQSGENEYSGFMSDILASGDKIELMCVTKILEGHEEDWSRIVITYEDVTERKRFEAIIENAREDNELQREFIAILSHEFRTALAIIDGSARRLGRKWSEITLDDVQTTTENIRTTVSRMLTQIDTNLTSSRVEKGMMNEEFVDINLRSLINEICQRQEMASDNVTVLIDLSSLPDSIEGIPSALEHIFSNLLSNAIKYSSLESTVAVAGITTDADVYISVRDHGVGIPDTDMKNLFRQYFRAATAKGFQGTGIGLHLVRQLVDLHKGSINVDSVEGRGSIFTVCLPRKQLKNHNLKNIEVD